MAVELFSENMVMSPRISFSHDLSQTDTVPVEQHLLRTNSSSSIDFDFCVFRESFDQDSSSADELFSDGMILPIQIKKKMVMPKKVKPPAPLPPPPLLPPPPPRPPHEPHDIAYSRKIKKTTESSKEMKMESSESDEKQNSKSFWRFKRSSSLNCGSGYTGGLCPLPLLSRSNSTGSSPTVKRSSLSKDNFNHKQHSQKNPPVVPTKPSQSSASSTTTHQRPPLKKSYGSYGNGVRINPLLNVPSANLFGLGSIFSGSKDKNKRK